MSVYGIIPDIKNGTYLGGLFNPVEDEEHLYCFEDASKQDVDIAIRFLSFAEIDGGDVFPKEEALSMYKRGGALFIKLEPWSASAPDDSSFNLRHIIDGGYDKQLKAFAKQAKKSGVPLFVTFGPAPQITGKFPWGKEPEVYKEAFRHVHDKISVEYGADNITWVWNPNVEIASDRSLLDYDPQYDLANGKTQTGRYYTYVALNGSHTSSDQTFQDIFEPSLNLVSSRYPGMEFMIGEFASSGTDVPDRTAIFNEAIEYVANQRPEVAKHPYKIFAYLYFDMDDEGNAFSIIKPQDKAAYATALKKQDDLFRKTIGYGLFERTIQLADKSYLDRYLIKKPETPCSEIEGTWYDWWEKKPLDRIKSTIQRGETRFNTNSGVRIGDPHEDNLMRIELAKAYIEMTNYAHDINKIDELYVKARDSLIAAINSPGPAIIHWQRLPYIRYYFEARLQLAEVFKGAGHFEESIAICQETLSGNNEKYDFVEKKYVHPYLQREGLQNRPARVAHHVRLGAVPGMEARAKLILADNYVLMGPEKLEEAKKLYQEIIDWAKAATDVSWATSRWYVPDFLGYAVNWAELAWQTGELSNQRDKILYLAAIAQLSKAEILVRQGKIDEALSIYDDILSWEAVGQEEEFLDLAFKSLIGAMTACASTGNYNDAIQLFSDKLPWEKIEQYADLKESLDVQEKLFESLPPKEKWELMKYGLRTIHIEPRYREKLKKIFLLDP